MSRANRVTKFGPDMVAEINDKHDEFNNRLNALEVSKTKTFQTKILVGGGAIQHNLGRTPKTLSVALKGVATWYEYKNRDEKALYLKSSADVDAEVTVT